MDIFLSRRGRLSQSSHTGEFRGYDLVPADAGKGTSICVEGEAHIHSIGRVAGGHHFEINESLLCFSLDRGEKVPQSERSDRKQGEYG